ncbi:hypothetical protein HID58_070577, partial [Brassica napus]
LQVASMNITLSATLNGPHILSFFSSYLSQSQRSRECSICWQLFVLKDPARTIYLLASSGSLCQTLIPVTKICGLGAKRLQL